MSLEKENFLRTKLVGYLQRIDPATPPRWGRMTLQHMIEHFAGDAVRNANGKVRISEMHFPPETVEKLRSFMMSDKPFPENTRNPLMAEEPAPLHFRTVQGAIGALQQELIYFFQVYEENPGMVIRNPFYGDLNFEENVQLLYKHALHHLKQFGVEPLSR